MPRRGRILNDRRQQKDSRRWPVVHPSLKALHLLVVRNRERGLDTLHFDGAEHAPAFPSSAQRDERHKAYWKGAPLATPRKQSTSTDREPASTMTRCRNAGGAGTFGFCQLPLQHVGSRQRVTRQLRRPWPSGTISLLSSSRRSRSPGRNSPPSRLESRPGVSFARRPGYFCPDRADPPSQASLTLKRRSARPAVGQSRSPDLRYVGSGRASRH